MHIENKLREIFRGEVTHDEKVLDEFSRDASIFEIKPRVVVSPKDKDDVENLVRFVSENKAYENSLSLTPRSAGTDMSGGPLTESIAVDFLKHFQGILNIDKENKTATVLPGTFYRDFETATLEKDLLLPCYTASRDLNTMGGMVANNSGGEKTLKYGKTEDYVESLKVVFSDGVERVVKPLTKDELDKKISKGGFEGDLYGKVWNLIQENEEVIKKAKPKVSKNSAGYYLWNVWNGKIFDLTKLIVGSQGTLGIVTEVKFKLVKPKKHSTLLVMFLRDFSNLSEIVRKILLHKPESFESYDDQTTKIAFKFMPAMIKFMGAKNLISLGLKFWPEALMTLTGGLPKLVMVAEFTGDSEEEIYSKANKAKSDVKGLCAKTRITKNDAEEEKYWTIRRQSFNLLRHHVQGKHTAPFIDDISVRPEFLPKFLPRLQKIMGHYDILYTIAGHIGDGNFHIIPLMNFKRPDFEKIIRNLSKEVYDLVLEFEGSITGEHNDGLIRTPFLSQMYGDKIVSLFGEIKGIFDPKNIFNPGKKVSVGKGKAGSLDYVFKHLLKS